MSHHTVYQEDFQPIVDWLDQRFIISEAGTVVPVVHTVECRTKYFPGPPEDSDYYYAGLYRPPRADDLSSRTYSWQPARCASGNRPCFVRRTLRSGAIPRSYHAYYS
jgi:hypothetical protein